MPVFWLGSLVRFFFLRSRSLSEFGVVPASLRRSADSLVVRRCDESHTPGLDFTGTANGPLTLHYGVLYLVLTAALLTFAFFGPARQLLYSD